MSRFMWPVDGFKVAQGFGADPAYYKQLGENGHNGIDLAVPAGTPIKASADGTVVFEGWGKYQDGTLASWFGTDAGIAVMIDHGDVYTGYAHMMRTVVNAGQSVKQGQVIGYVGSTGTASGPHVHFEFIGKPPNFKNGWQARLDPASFNVGGSAPAAPAASQKGDDEMITRKGLEAVFQAYLGRTPDAGAYTHYVGNYTIDFTVDDVKKSVEYGRHQANLKAAAAAAANMKSALASTQAENTTLKAQLAAAKTAPATPQTVTDPSVAALRDSLKTFLGIK